MAGAGLLDHELLHVPGPGRATLGTQAAVQADVLYQTTQAGPSCRDKKPGAKWQAAAA